MKAFDCVRQFVFGVVLLRAGSSPAEETDQRLLVFKWFFYHCLHYQFRMQSDQQADPVPNNLKNPEPQSSEQQTDSVPENPENPAQQLSQPEDDMRRQLSDQQTTPNSKNPTPLPQTSKAELVKGKQTKEERQDKPTPLPQQQKEKLQQNLQAKVEGQQIPINPTPLSQLQSRKKQESQQKSTPLPQTSKEELRKGQQTKEKSEKPMNQTPMPQPQQSKEERQEQPTPLPQPQKEEQRESQQRKEDLQNGHGKWILLVSNFLLISLTWVEDHKSFNFLIFGLVVVLQLSKILKIIE